RRQYKAIRTALLCAKARALARLGQHRDAEAALATAVRACPRGAVDPLIVLEASKALAFSLRGDVTRGSVHFDRALAFSLRAALTPRRVPVRRGAPGEPRHRPQAPRRLDRTPAPHGAARDAR